MYIDKEGFKKYVSNFKILHILKRQSLCATGKLKVHSLRYDGRTELDIKKDFSEELYEIDKYFGNVYYYRGESINIVCLLFLLIFEGIFINFFIIMSYLLKMAFIPIAFLFYIKV